MSKVEQRKYALPDIIQNSVINPLKIQVSYLSLKINAFGMLMAQCKLLANKILRLSLSCLGNIIITQNTAIYEKIIQIKIFSFEKFLIIS